MNTVAFSLEPSVNRLSLCDYSIGDSIELARYHIDRVIYARFAITVYVPEGYFDIDLETDRFKSIDGKVYEIVEFYKHGMVYVFTLKSIDLFNQQDLNPDKDKVLYEEDI